MAVFNTSHERNASYLFEAHERLRTVQLTDTDYGADEETKEALAAVIHDLETVMSDRFDLSVES